MLDSRSDAHHSSMNIWYPLGSTITADALDVPLMCRSAAACASGEPDQPHRVIQKCAARAAASHDAMSVHLRAEGRLERSNAGVSIPRSRRQRCSDNLRPRAPGMTWMTSITAPPREGSTRAATIPMLQPPRLSTTACVAHCLC